MTWSSFDHNSIFTGDENGMIVQWRLAERAFTSFDSQRNGICTIKASPHSSSVLAIGYHSGLALVISVNNGQFHILQQFVGLDSEISSLSWCPIRGDSFLKDASNDESEILVATAGKRLIQIWSLNTGKELLYKKIASGDKLGSQDLGKRRIWLEIQWPHSSPEFLISNSPGQTGELLLWNLQTWKQKPDKFDISDVLPSEVIFSITFVGDKICTFSIDGVLAVWNLRSRSCLVSWPSFSGLPCIKASPVDPGMVAIGSGDNKIKIWNQNNESEPVDVTTLFYGIRKMIASVAWHPVKEGLLAYGAEDGQVGVFDTLEVKPPRMSSTSHTRKVYVVCWGPSVQARPGSEQYEVCSLGDGTILQHCFDEFRSRKNALNLVDTVNAANDPQTEWCTPTYLLWKADFTAFLIGYDNGSVRVYSFPDLRQVWVIKDQQRMINCIKWHPGITAESIHSSPCRNWVAFAGCDQHISVVKLPAILESGSVTLPRPLCQMPSHVSKTTDMCWSPHNDGRLVTVGYDGFAIVWNLKTGEAQACYSQHNDRLSTVLWSNLDPDIIVIGGFDTTVRIWKVSAHSKVVPETSENCLEDLPSDQDHIRLKELQKLKQLAQQVKIPLKVSADLMVCTAREFSQKVDKCLTDCFMTFSELEVCKGDEDTESLIPKIEEIQHQSHPYSWNKSQCEGITIEEEATSLVVDDVFGQLQDDFGPMEENISENDLSGPGVNSVIYSDTRSSGGSFYTDGSEDRPARITPVTSFATATVQQDGSTDDGGHDNDA